MKLLLNFSSGFIFSLLLPTIAFAHETEVVHEEPVPTIDPTVAIIVIIGIAIIGFILWKFVFNKKEAPSK